MAHEQKDIHFICTLLCSVLSNYGCTLFFFKLMSSWLFILDLIGLKYDTIFNHKNGVFNLVISFYEKEKKMSVILWLGNVINFSLETSSLFGTFLPCGPCAGWMRRLSLLTRSLWSVQQSAPHIVFATLTSCLSFLCTMTYSMRCQCLEWGCIRDVLLRVGRLMLCTLLQKAIAVALSYSFSPNHSFPGLMVCAHSSIEVSAEDEFVCPGCSRNHRI